MTSVQTYRTTTLVGPGHRIEVIAPELAEGETVEVLLVPQRPEHSGGSFLDLVDSFPTGPRSAATWDEVETNLRAERESWER